MFLKFKVTAFWALIWLLCLNLVLEYLFVRAEPPFFFGKEVYAYIISLWVTLLLGLLILKVFKSIGAIFWYSVFLSFLFVIVDLYAAHYGDFPSIRMVSMIGTGAEFWDTGAYYLEPKHFLALMLSACGLTVFYLSKRVVLHEFDKF